ncbi:MAG: hypothetical protein FWF02_00520 [Micrococcales bacterium]|nr:hypothetical protein [Micrococcales bacterium]MCL2666181.1 hypothetical protein [Micrococcales bacterium]
MTVVKKSVSLDSQLAEQVRQAAADEGVSFSMWLGAAASDQLTLRAGRAALAEYEAEAGPLTEVELAEGGRILDDLLDRAARTQSAA